MLNDEPVSGVASCPEPHLGGGGRDAALPLHTRWVNLKLWSHLYYLALALLKEML